jgi:alcohol dehydrogenase (cytochrome c)
MNRTTRALLTASLLVAPVWLLAQEQAPSTPGNQGGLDPAAILKPLADSWPTYSGDYTGRRYSALTQINQTTVKTLTLAWTSKLTGGLPGAGGGFGGGRGGGRGGAGGGARVNVGGLGAEEFAFNAPPNVKGSILQVDGVLYVTAPDNVWALDARDGHELWRYFWKTRGGTHIGNRGAGLWHNYLFFETPDNVLVSLDARTGKERWNVPIASFAEEYFSTTAPIVVGNHVLVGTGNDIDAPGFLQSFDPETGALQWKLYTVPMKPGDPGLETWPNLEAARHGGAQTWIPGSYDPETKFYILGTGNPTPGYTGQGRLGDNLFTCTIIAVNVDTGKMACTEPRRNTHDWTRRRRHADRRHHQRAAAQLVATASRNGYYFARPGHRRNPW